MAEENYVNLYEPRTMMAARETVLPPRRFFHETFFSRNVLFDTKTVELDVRKRKRRVAVFVNPLLNGHVVEREGFQTETVKPAYTKELMPIRPVDVRDRSFGENIRNAKTPLERAAEMLSEDMQFLDTRIIRLEEKMCAEALLTGKVTVKGQGWDSLVDFGYQVGRHLKPLSGTACWDQAGSDPMKDLDGWIVEIGERTGLMPTHCIIGRNVYWSIIDNPVIKERLDIRRYEMGMVSPRELPRGISYLGELLLPSGVVSLYSYLEWYTDAVTGVSVPLMDPGTVLLASTEAGSHYCYGMIQNMNALVPSTRFPWSWMKEDGSARWLQLESAPMPCLGEVDAFIVADVLT